MIDFSSALYLGLRHPAATLGAWPALTTGKPAALHEAPAARALAAQLAQLQRLPAATLLPSTLHLFLDLFAMLAGEPLVVLVDGGAYPVARRGACASGLPLRVFRRGDVDGAARLARAWGQAGRRPLILADGVCPGAPDLPPLLDYAALARDGRGYLLLDDTQALGVLGPGGAGSAALHGLGSDNLLVGASLAKAFGAPLAVLAGSAALIARFERHSQTRLHGGAPSCVALAAGLRALAVNRRHGDILRARLLARVRQLHGALAGAGIACRGGLFPVQSVPLAPGIDVLALHAALRADGYETVPAGRRVLTLLLRADHHMADVAGVAAALVEHLRRMS